MRSGATYTQPFGASQAAWIEQIVPLPQSLKTAVFTHRPVLPQMRPSAQRTPPHIGPVTLTFDLHNRHTYSEELVKTNRGYRRYTATIGVLTADNTLLSRAVVQNDFRSAADLLDRITGGRGQISGGFTDITGARDLAVLLRGGALPVYLATRHRFDIQFNATVTAAHWHEDSREWEVSVKDGETLTGRFLITAIGPLSAPTMPNTEPAVPRRRDSSTNEPAMSASGMIAMTKAVGTAVPTCSAIACGLRLTDMLGPITARHSPRAMSSVTSRSARNVAPVAAFS